MRGLIQSAMNNGNGHSNHEFALPSSSNANSTFGHGIGTLPSALHSKQAHSLFSPFTTQNRSKLLATVLIRPINSKTCLLR